MTTITLEVPDDLALRLQPVQDQLPALLSLALELSRADAQPAISSQAIVHPVLDEMLDFLAHGPTPEKIIAFRVSPGAQARLEALLDKNREEGLTEAEAAELDANEQVSFVISLLKARARLALAALN
jgi:hypothetical protein